jgi:hypothetical protein
MARTSPRRPSAGRLVVALAVMAGFAAGVVAPSGSALAPSKKLAHLTLDIYNYDGTAAVPHFGTVVQSGVTGKSNPLAASTTFVFKFSIQNDAHSPQAFGSFQIQVPTGFTVASPSVAATGGAQGMSVKDVSGTGAGPLLVTTTGPTGSGVVPSNTAAVTVTVNSPASAGCNTTWPTGVKQSNDFSGSGNDFNVNSASTPTTGSDHLVWTTQPSDVQVNTAMGTSPAVTVKDACGNTDTSLDPLTVTATDESSDPKVPVPSFQATTSSGVATFSPVTYTTFGYDHALHATATGLQDCAAGGTCHSSSFHVYQVLVPCSDNGKTDCTASNVFDPGNTTGISVDAAAGTTKDTLTIDIFGSSLADFGTCNQPAGSNEPIIGNEVRLNVNDRTKVAVLEITKNFFNLNPLNGTPFMDICLDTAGTTTTFQDKFGNNVSATSTPTYGLIQDCANNGNVPPCINSRNKNAANEFITFTLPAGDPHLGGF